MKSIIISGASGFIGSFLSNYFSAKGDKVTHITRRTTNSKYEQILFQDLNTEYLKKYEPTNTFLINLSGAGIGDKKWSLEYKKLIIDSRVNSTNTIVKSLATTGIKLINASAVGYYGDAEEHNFTESNPKGNGFLSDVCQIWEDAALQYENTLISRFGIILDKKQGALPKMIAPFKMFTGGHLGNGKQWMPWIHIQDVLELMNFSIENNLNGIVNFVSPNPVRNREFADIAGKLLHRPSHLNVPEFALRALLGEQADLILFSQRVIPEIALNAGYEFKFPDLEIALNDLLRK